MQTETGPDSAPEAAPKQLKRMKTLNRSFKPKGRKLYARTNEATRNIVAVQTAAGATVPEIAKAMSLSESAVTRIRSEPEVRAQIDEYRLMIKENTLNRVNGYVSKLHDRIGKEVDEAKPAELRDLTAAALNIEKVSASATGQPLGVVHQAPSQQPVQEAKELLLALIGIKTAGA